MSKEQSLDDILKLLKNSYDSGTAVAEAEKDDKVSLNEKISDTELESRLKAQFFGGKNASSTDSEGSFDYDINEDFLDSVAPEDDAEDDEPPFDLEDEVIEDEVIEDEVIEDEVIEDEVIEDEVIEDEVIEDEVIEDEVIEDEVIEDEVIEDEVIEDEVIEDEVIEDEVIEDEVIEDEVIEDEVIEDEVIEDEVIEDEVIEDEVIDDETDDSEVIESDDVNVKYIQWPEDDDDKKEDALAEFFDDDDSKYRRPVPSLYSDENGQLTLFENLSDADSIEITEDSKFEDHCDENQIALDFGDIYDDREDDSSSAQSNVDTSFLGLMMECGGKVAIGKNVNTEWGDIYGDKSSEDESDSFEASDAFGFMGDEYSNTDQADEIIDSYLKDKKFTGLRLIGSGVFALFLVLFELIPYLPIGFTGLLDYTRYPSAFMLIGIQLLLFSCLFAWRELLYGFKKMFGLKSNRWSLCSLCVSVVMIYQIVMAVLSQNELAPMFGSIAAIYVFIGLLGEYLSVKREIKSFEVYSCDSVKYTFETEPHANSAAEKMYRGGVPSKINIFEPREVSFPEGYFSEVNATPASDPFINGAVISIVFVSAVLWVLSMCLGAQFAESFPIFVLSFVALCPMAVFVSSVLPMYIASSRLYKRESAIASEVSAEKYAACDIMIFRDSHLFRKSLPSDNGIVIYDEKDSRRVVSYLNAIYDAIGGPMKGIFDEVSDKEYSVKLRRIARNGIEAVVDKHSVILGEREFMLRYGIRFSNKETVREGEGILCLAIDSKPAAKLCLKYKSEPIFEMILSKMEENGIRCAVETYDPVINSAFVTASRENKRATINVVHKNVTDYYSEMPENVEGKTGLVACSSRLKLVECVIWCKRIFAVKRVCRVIHIATAVISALLLGFAVGFGLTGTVNQYYALIVQGAGIVPTLAVISFMLPSEKYMAVTSNTDKKKHKEKKSKEDKKKEKKEKNDE